MWGPAVVMIHDVCLSVHSFVCPSVCHVQISLKLSEIDVWLLRNWNRKPGFPIQNLPSDSRLEELFRHFGCFRVAFSVKLHTVVPVHTARHGENHNMGKSSWVYPGWTFAQKVKELSEGQILSWRFREITVKCILWLCKYVIIIITVVINTIIIAIIINIINLIISIIIIKFL